MARTDSQLSASEIIIVQQLGDGILRLVETTAPSATAGVGKLYVKSSDSDLYFLDGAGNEINISTGSGGTPTAITVANEATDTTCFPLFVTAATGDLGPKTNVNMTFNSNTGVLTLASSVLTTTDINGGTIDGVTIGGASAGAITGTTITVNTNIVPDANDGAGIGISGTAFSDLFLASGAVIDFAAGNSVITHSSGVLTVSTGDLRVTTAGTNTASVVTVGGAQTLTSKVLTAATITTSLVPTTDDGAALGSSSNRFSDLFLAEGGVINWDAGDITLTQTNNELVLAGGNLDIGTNILRIAGDVDIEGQVPADDTFTGNSTSSFLAGATIAQWDAVYLNGSTRWALTDADTTSTAAGLIGIATAAGTDGGSLKVLLPGSFFRNDGGTSWTVGGTIYLHTSAGKFTQTQPSGTGDVIRVIGWAVGAKTIYFCPSGDYITRA